MQDLKLTNPTIKDLRFLILVLVRIAVLAGGKVTVT